MLHLDELAIGIVILGIVLSVGASILINVGNTNTQNSSAYNISNSAANSLTEFGSWFKILIIVGISAAILTLIFISFGRPAEEGQEGSY